MSTVFVRLRTLNLTEVDSRPCIRVVTNEPWPFRKNFAYLTEDVTVDESGAAQHALDMLYPFPETEEEKKREAESLSPIFAANAEGQLSVSRMQTPTCELDSDKVIKDEPEETVTVYPLGHYSNAQDTADALGKARDLLNEVTDLEPVEIYTFSQSS